MNVIIMGCGRVGAQLAETLIKDGHRVTVLDIDPNSFKRIPPDFGGVALLGDGTDEDALRKAGIEDAEAFIAVTQSDNRNIMAAQIAKHIFKVPRVMCRIYDPLREEIYHTLGLEAISPTSIFTKLLKEKLVGEK